MGVVSKIAYRPVGILAGAGAGLLAGYLFRKIWSAVSGEETAPKATDERRGWPEVLVAAALHGAIFALVRAAVDKAGATGVRRLARLATS